MGGDELRKARRRLAEAQSELERRGWLRPDGRLAWDRMQSEWAEYAPVTLFWDATPAEAMMQVDAGLRRDARLQAARPTAERKMLNKTWWQKRADVWTRIRIRALQDLKPEVIRERLISEERNKKPAERLWVPSPRTIRQIVMAGKRREFDPRRRE